jgi:hypothetical protein
MSYSATILEAIFERLLTYDYLARPSKVVPMAAEAMPVVTDNGKTWTFKITKGIYFAPDPAFKGKKRELTAQDFVYSYMRFMDPKNRSPYAFLLEGKIVGLDELAAKARQTGKFDYDAKVPGMEVVDPVHAALSPQGNGLQLSVQSWRTRRWVPWRERSSKPTATTRWGIRWAPGRTPLKAGPGAPRSCWRRTRIPGLRLGLPADGRPVGQDALRDDEGPAACRRSAASRSRSSRSRNRGGLRFQQKEIDYMNVPETFAPNVSTATS